MPKPPPTCGEMQRIFVSGMPNTNAVISSRITCGACEVIQTVYSPVDGSVIAITPVVLNGARLGSRIDVQPTGAASLVVSISHVRADPALAVGSPVTAGASRLGSIVDFSRTERQALARYTNDSGNHVVVEVHPSASLAVG